MKIFPRVYFKEHGINQHQRKHKIMQRGPTSLKYLNSGNRLVHFWSTPLGAVFRSVQGQDHCAGV